MTQKTAQQEISFEQATERLEKIVEQMNSGTLHLEQSLHLYEEAHHLIQRCQKQLTAAEHKIEVLLKNRNGDLLVGEDGTPSAQELTNSSHQ